MGIREPLLEPMSTKEDIQFRAIMKMFERVSQPKDTAKYDYSDTDVTNYVKMTTK